MQTIKATVPRVVLGVILFVLGPFLTLPGLLLLERMTHFYQALSALPLFLSVAVGVVGIAIYPVRRLIRIAAVLPYIVLVGGAVLYEGLALACAWFGDCL